MEDTLTYRSVCVSAARAIQAIDPRHRLSCPVCLSTVDAATGLPGCTHHSYVLLTSLARRHPGSWHGRKQCGQEEARAAMLTLVEEPERLAVALVNLHVVNTYGGVQQSIGTVLDVMRTLAGQEMA